MIVPTSATGRDAAVRWARDLVGFVGHVAGLAQLGDGIAATRHVKRVRELRADSDSAAIHRHQFRDIRRPATRPTGLALDFWRVVLGQGAPRSSIARESLVHAVLDGGGAGGESHVLRGFGAKFVEVFIKARVGTLGGFRFGGSGGWGRWRRRRWYKSVRRRLGRNKGRQRQTADYKGGNQRSKDCFSQSAHFRIFSDFSTGVSPKATGQTRFFQLF